MEGYATAAEVAAYFHISKGMVYKVANEMLETPEGDGVLKIGTLTRIQPAKFEAFLARRKEKDNDVQREIETGEPEEDQES